MKPEAKKSVSGLFSPIQIHTHLILFALALISLLTTSAPATAHAISTPLVALQIGTQTVRIPTPAGFIETSRRSPDLWATALAFSAGDARIIAHFVTVKDLAAHEKGKTVLFNEFMLVQTPHRAESLKVTQAQFDKLRSGTIAVQDNLAQRLEPQLATELDRVSKAVSSDQAASIQVRVGEIVPVSVDRNGSRLLIYTVLSQAGVMEGKAPTSQTVVASTAYCFVVGKVVMLTYYRQFHSPQDLQVSRSFMETWANSVLSSN